MFGPGCVSAQDVCLGHLLLTLKNVARVCKHAGVQAGACVRVSAQVRVPGIRACLCPHLRVPALLWLCEGPCLSPSPLLLSVDASVFVYLCVCPWLWALHLVCLYLCSRGSCFPP